MVSGINIRVYGLWLNASEEVLVSREMIAGKAYLKFPGGGLIPGEGLIDALKREWMEELNSPVRVREHFYTTDYFQPSAWDNSQVISVYYLVEPEAEILLPHSGEKEVFYFLPVQPALHQALSLPIDKVVGKMLVEQSGRPLRFQ